ncbi:uncharacterized protein KY384_003063 [Bacidia gigantensis]|uniref:uncharacterized protein n=1 Tax=Bacidia gigantensis TaxID=2732470 RepID=UPI001D047331|nr:uncharacterized protein KY384_003063 [Bacidia gigantensis]KAG8531434.1 hypothetical protein KY384_003063 [Bacidia gigantensis]
MVGVPEPNCKRCSDTGRTCEGYARYPTFLINTPEGRRRRERLEEAKPRTPSTDSPASRSDTPLARVRKPSTGDKAMVPRTDFSALPQQASIAQLQDDQLLACFWINYVPIGSLAQHPSPCPWLQEIMFTTDPHPALKLSLKALALTRLGWLNQDDALSKMGQSNYGLALKHIQHALWDPLAKWSDHTLAAAHLLSIYELFEATNDSVKGWNSHVSGLGLLVRLRGPDSYESPMGQAILFGFSSGSMIHSLQFRKGTFLMSEEWKVKYFTDPVDEFHYRLLEFGFELASTLEETDRQRLQQELLSLDRCISYVNMFLALDSRMEDWLQDFTSHCGDPLYVIDFKDSYCSGIPDMYKGFIFRNYRQANVLNTFWSLKLILNHILTTIRAALGVRSAHFKTAGGPNAPAGEDRPDFLGGDRSDHCLELATNIMRAMPYVLKDEMGLLGAQQSIFPLRVALLVLKRYPGEELRWCESIYSQFNSKKGIRYATEIAKYEGGYKDDQAPTMANTINSR